MTAVAPQLMKQSTCETQCQSFTQWSIDTFFLEFIQQFKPVMKFFFLLSLTLCAPLLEKRQNRNSGASGLILALSNAGARSISSTLSDQKTQAQLEGAVASRQDRTNLSAMADFKPKEPCSDTDTKAAQQFAAQF